MPDDFKPTDFPQDMPQVNPDAADFTAVVDVPSHLEVSPDGQETLVIGDPEGAKEYNHQQGDNIYGLKGTCGLVSCEDVLRQFGLNLNETDMVSHAATRGMCQITDDPDQSGGTKVTDQAQILNDYGVPAHAEVNGTLDSLAANVETGHAVIIEANAGVLWNDANYYSQGEANHAVVVTGVATDPL